MRKGQRNLRYPGGNEISREERNAREGRNPVPNNHQVPFILNPLTTFLLVLVMPAARNYGPRFIKASHPQICGENVCEYGEERVGALERASSAIFFAAKVLFCFPIA